MSQTELNKKVIIFGKIINGAALYRNNWDKNKVGISCYYTYDLWVEIVKDIHSDYIKIETMKWHSGGGYR
jgi:hypothetical protein